MTETTLQQQVERLTSIEAIKDLKARYCAFCDDGYDADGICSVFEPDGVFDGGEEFGVHRGHRAIHTFFSGVSSQITFAAHLVLNPVISVDGDRANAKWWLLMPCTLRDEGGQSEGRWLVSQYNDDMVRRDGVWRFQAVRAVVRFFVPHLEDWADRTTARDS